MNIFEERKSLPFQKYVVLQEYYETVQLTVVRKSYSPYYPSTTIAYGICAMAIVHVDQETAAFVHQCYPITNQSKRLGPT